MKIKTNSFFLLEEGAYYSSIAVGGVLVFSGIYSKKKTYLWKYL